MSAKRGTHDREVVESFSDGLPSVITAAHELKSPLALIRQLSLMLVEGDLDLSEQKRMLNQISLTSEQALRLTSDLTRSARLSDAMFTLEPINPQQLCEDIIYELTPLFREYGKDFKLATRKHPLLMVANRDLLRRILMSFSDNALHYADDNSIIEIKIQLHNSGQTVRLGVRDYGPKISKNVIPKSGRALSKNSSINSRPQSSGLGLYIATQFADAMNGRIGVTRHRDGSTFYIDLQASRQLSLI